MSWFNFYGLLFVAAILVPNLLFAMRHREGFENLWQNKTVETLEQIDRFACFGLMVFNIPGTWFGFASDACRTLYLSVGGALVAAYCAVWAVCFNRPGVFRALALSILPSLLFLFSGAMLRSVPLIAAAALFAPCHILLSYKNAVLARVYLKKEEATARADFSSVQGGKSKV